jgi:hypothetical protein
MIKISSKLKLIKNSSTLDFEYSEKPGKNLEKM